MTVPVATVLALFAIAGILILAAWIKSPRVIAIAVVCGYILGGVTGCSDLLPRIGAGPDATPPAAEVVHTEDLGE